MEFRDAMAVRVLGVRRDLKEERQTGIRSESGERIETVGLLAVSAERKLAGVHPEVASRVVRVLAAMAALGFPMTVVAGVRSSTEQAALYAQGRTAPGPIVTRADGVVKTSNHQVWADGVGHAVDCVFVDAQGQLSWSESFPWAAYGACAEAVGLTWGGSWRSFPDRPHVEWHGTGDVPGVKA